MFGQWCCTGEISSRALGLLPEDWAGWPLRKDSPLGYEEVAFTHNTPHRILPSPELKKLKPKKIKYRAH